MIGLFQCGPINLAEITDQFLEAKELIETMILFIFSQMFYFFNYI